MKNLIKTALFFLLSFALLIPVTLFPVFAASLPACTTMAATDITENTAVLSGVLTLDGGYKVTSYGFSLSSDNYKTCSFKYYSSESLQKNLTISYTAKNLVPNTTYRFQFFVTNTKGDSSYGTIRSFTTLSNNESNINATSIKLDRSNISLGIGETEKISATVKPSSYDGDIDFSSTNTKVAIVSSSGKITAKAAGTCKIYAETDNGLTASCIVNVSGSAILAAPTITSPTPGNTYTADKSIKFNLNSVTGATKYYYIVKDLTTGDTIYDTSQSGKSLSVSYKKLIASHTYLFSAQAYSSSTRIYSNVSTVTITLAANDPSAEKSTLYTLYTNSTDHTNSKNSFGDTDGISEKVQSKTGYTGISTNINLADINSNLTKNDGTYVNGYTFVGAAVLNEMNQSSHVCDLGVVKSGNDGHWHPCVNVYNFSGQYSFNFGAGWVSSSSHWYEDTSINLDGKAIQLTASVTGNDEITYLVIDTKTWETVFTISLMADGANSDGSNVSFYRETSIAYPPDAGNYLSCRGEGLYLHNVSYTDTYLYTTTEYHLFKSTDLFFRFIYPSESEKVNTTLTGNDMVRVYGNKIYKQEVFLDN